MHETIIDKLRRRIGAENILRLSAPRPARVFVWVDRGKLKEAVKFLKEEGFTHLSAITGLEAEGCIELLYHLSREGTILTLRVAVPPDVGFAPTITDEIPGAALYEREIYDLLGVRFDGHQNLERLILPDESPENFHPLRKDEEVKKAPIGDAANAT